MTAVPVDHPIAPEFAPTEYRGQPGTRHTVAVAVSGGRDSTALLHSTLRSAAGLGLQVLALHVNHGLMPQADQWQRDLQRRCDAWARRGAPLQLICERIADQPARGDSVEAWGRRVRYGALRSMALAAGCNTVLLAHHRRDQAETFLLQALRGGGVAGIAGMPAAALRDGIFWLRPWLQQPREAVEAYVRRHRLRFVDDDSNADPRWARNRLRAQVWPALTQAFPDAEQVLGDAARWAGLASSCLRDLAEIDLAQVADEQGLLLEHWLDLSPARRNNALRAWLNRRAGRAPPASLIERLMAQWPGNATDKSHGGRTWEWDSDRLVAQAGRLVFLTGASRPAAPANPLQSTPPIRLVITRPGQYPVPQLAGSLLVNPVSTTGVPLARLATVELRARAGGEQFQAGPRRPPRSLKKQFQAVDVPAWARDGPLVYGNDNQLIHVAGLGLDARAVVEQGADLMSLTWQPEQGG